MLFLEENLHLRSKEMEPGFNATSARRVFVVWRWIPRWRSADKMESVVERFILGDPARQLCGTKRQSGAISNVQIMEPALVVVER
mgnify:CR=1 FL=1